jgi:c(7)-type cytochrome triheme protein
MKSVASVLAVLAALLFAASAMAVPPGKTVDYAGGAAGKVVFDGKAHADKGLKCSDCHTKLFQMKKGSVSMTMADLNGGKFCGSCHNGTAAFATSDAASCAKCHKK